MELSSASLYNKLEGGPDAALQYAALSVLKDATSQDGELLDQLLEQQPDPAQLAQQQIAEGRRLDVRV